MSLIDRASMATPATMYFTQSIGAVGIHFLGGDSSFHSSLESQPISELFIHRTCPAHSNPLHIRIFEAVSSISSISTVFPMWSHAIMVACIELFFYEILPFPALCRTVTVYGVTVILSYFLIRCKIGKCLFACLGDSYRLLNLACVVVDCCYCKYECSNSPYNYS